MSVLRPIADARVQWKGTDVCLDFHCACGFSGHLDGDFAYFLRCPGCSTTYEMPRRLELVVAGEFDEELVRHPSDPDHVDRMTQA